MITQLSKDKQSEFGRMKRKEYIQTRRTSKRVSKKRHAFGEIHHASIKKLNNKEEIRKLSKKSKNKRNNKAKDNQTDDILLRIANKQPDIIIITEMLPKNQKNDIPPTIWNINGYTQ